MLLFTADTATDTAAVVVPLELFAYHIFNLLMFCHLLTVYAITYTAMCGHIRFIFNEMVTMALHGENVKKVFHQNKTLKCRS